MVQVSSSNIRAVELRDQNGAPVTSDFILTVINDIGGPPPTVGLLVQFTSGDNYLYHDVPFGKAVAVALGDSCGKALNEQIKKGGYRFEKMQTAQSVPSPPKDA